MTAHASPATPRLMALARCIGGAVRGFGRKVLAAVSQVEVSEAAATPVAPEVVELIHRLQELMTEFQLNAAGGAPEELCPPHIQAPQRRDVLAGALAEYRSLDRKALLRDPEYLAFLARFVAAFGSHMALNWRMAGAGMASLWRVITRFSRDFFELRICALRGIAS